MTTVVLAEKPSVGRDIAKVLGATRRGDGFLAGNGYVVTWAIGHLVHLAEPAEYNSSWKGRWSFHQLPMVPDVWRLALHENTSSQFNTVAGLLNDDQTHQVICATDAGREGEHIFRLIYEHAGCTKPFKRLWISSLTEEAIRDGFQKLQPGEAFDDLAAAAKARARADWLVGLNLTRAYTVHNGTLCTIGRVQTPTLGMIVKREHEIVNFTKAYYYEIEAAFAEGFNAKYVEDDKTRIDSKVVAQRVYQKLKPEKTGLVQKVAKKTKKHKPPALYDLIGLQKDANKRYGMTAAQVLEHAQKLYETFKLITYPRTESRHISEDMVPSLPGILKNLNHPHGQAALARIQSGHKLSKAYVDKSKLSDHHGILPTGRRPSGGLSRPQRLIYDLIVDRFVAMFLEDHVIEETRVWVQIGDETFLAKGNKVVEVGWKVVHQSGGKPADSEAKIPPLKKGEILNINDLQLLEKETNPPKRYTDATLLTAMKNAGREVEDDELAEAMKESGLGTPATRAEMIEKLVRTRMIERKSKLIHPTEKGKALIGLVEDSLRSPELTGHWEQQLKNVENGELQADVFAREIIGYVRELIPRVQRSPVLSPTVYADERKPRDQGPPARQGGVRRDDPAKPKPKGGAAPPAKIGDKDVHGTCPGCGSGAIIEGNRAFGCTNYKRGCRFLIGKEIEGKKLTKAQVKKLIASGKTNLIKGFAGPDGVPFNAKLMLDPQKRVVIDPDSRAVDKPTPTGPLTCPKCNQGEIIEGKKGFGCNRFRQGCQFVVWKVIAEKKLTQIQVTRLIEKRKSTLIKGFKNKQGESFKAYLELTEDCRVIFTKPKT